MTARGSRTRHTAARLRARVVGDDAAGREDGFAAVELAILSSFLIVMLLLVVGLGRVSH